MIKNKEQKRPGAVFVVILAVLVAWGCSSLNAKQLAKKQEIETGKWEFYWDEEWIKTGTLRWHEHQNSLYINEEKGWAEGTFGKVENCDSYYLLQPIYRFKVVGPDKVEKEIVVRMGYIEHERVFSASEYLEGCWSEKVTFEPGSRVLDEKLLFIGIGERVKITFEGQEDVKENKMNLFTVEVAKNTEISKEETA